MKKLNHFPLFIYLLPLFFCLYGISNFGLHPTYSKIIIPFLVLMFIAAMIHLFIRWKFSNNQAPYIVSFLWFAFFLFFGNIKDAIPPTSFFYSYYVLFPLLILLPFLIGFVLNNRQKIRQEIFSYLNYLLLILSVVQIGMSIKNIKESFVSHVVPISFKPVTTSVKPSIYFILFDEYPGQISLNEIYQFKNETLLNHLRANHYHVFDTINSNYDKTVYSINSMMNIQYPNHTQFMPVKSYQTYLKNYAAIKENLLTKFLLKEGYSIKNLSLFDISDLTSKYSFSLLHTRNEAILRNRFSNRVVSDLRWMLYAGKFRTESFYQKYLLQTHHQNNEIINKTISESKEKHLQPVFHFAHLLLPHEPYFTDSSGNLYNMEFESHELDNTQKSLDYLKYTNLRMMQLSDSILKNDSKAIVILFSDHGYRDTPDEYRKFNCNNFMAVHFPDTNYNELKKMRTNINLFRIVLNQYFNQELPPLKDSSFSIDEVKNRFATIRLF